MKINIYIEKDEFDEFFIWVNRLNHGVLTSKHIEYKTSKDGLKDPLHLSIESDMYILIADAENDLKKIDDEYGDFDLSYDSLSETWELRTIKNIAKNARRHDVEDNVICTALYTMSKIEGITPAEAMIIAEREWINSHFDESDLNI